MSASDYLENAMLDAVYNGVSYTSPGTIYLALFLTDPTDADAGTEVSGGGYTRQVVTFTTSVGGLCNNSNQPTFTATGADFGLITHMGFYDALTGGNLLDHAALDTPRTIVDTQTLEFLPGQLIVGRT